MSKVNKGGNAERLTKAFNARPRVDRGPLVVVRCLLCGKRTPPTAYGPKAFKEYCTDNHKEIADRRRARGLPVDGTYSREYRVAKK